MIIWSIIFIQSYFVVLWPPSVEGWNDWPPWCVVLVDAASTMPTCPASLSLTMTSMACREVVESHWFSDQEGKAEKTDWFWSSWCVKEASVREHPRLDASRRDDLVQTSQSLLHTWPLDALVRFASCSYLVDTRIVDLIVHHGGDVSFFEHFVACRIYHTWMYIFEYTIHAIWIAKYESLHAFYLAISVDSHLPPL